MTDHSSPGWGSSTLPSSSRPGAIKHSGAQPSKGTDENTPLLARSHTDINEEEQRPHTATSNLRSALTLPKINPRRRWPSLVALLILCIIVILIMIVGFVFPGAMHDYAMQAVVFEPNSLSVESFTQSGVNVRVEGLFHMDASQVEDKNVRNIGRFGTWIAGKVETLPMEVEVYLPEYGDLPLGTADVPRLDLDIRNGHMNKISVVAYVEPGDFSGLPKIARDWMEGRLGQLRVLGKAQVVIKSGFIKLPQQTIVQEVVFTG